MTEFSLYFSETFNEQLEFFFGTSSRFVIIYCFVTKVNLLFAENRENLISAHLEKAPTLKVQKFNKRPRINTVPYFTKCNKCGAFFLNIS